jgi:hypothetical protein
MTLQLSANHAARFKYDVTAISDMDSANLVLMQTNPVQESPNHFTQFPSTHCMSAAMHCS